MMGGGGQDPGTQKSKQPFGREQYLFLPEGETALTLSPFPSRLSDQAFKDHVIPSFLGSE